MERNQFTFYRSYRDALRELPPKEFKAAVLAICDYALDETEPSLSGIPNSVFILIRPTLDSGRIKAANRAKKMESNEEQTKNKRRTKQEETRKEGEKEGEGEREKERENDSSLPVDPLSGMENLSPGLRGAVEDWLRYKAERREPYKQQGLKSLITVAKNNAAKYGDAAVEKVIYESMSGNYKGIIFDRLAKAQQEQGGAKKPNQVQYDKDKAESAMADYMDW